MAHKSVGKVFLAACTKVTGTLKSAVLRCWYGLAWSIGRNTRFDGVVRRRSLGGDVILGRSCTIGHGLMIDVASGGVLQVGDNVSINAGTFISVQDRIEIGDDCRIGEYCSLRDNDHVFDDPAQPIRRQGMRSAPILLGRDVWLGRGAVIQNGVTIGDGAVIGANAFVNRDIPAGAVAVGAPARVVKRRGEVS